MFIADAIDLLNGLDRAKPSRFEDDILFHAANRSTKVFGRIGRGRLDEWIRITEDFAGLASRLRMAHPFSFSNVTIMNMADGVDPEGAALFDNGTIKLPFESCWFEYDAGHAAPGMKFGLLVEATPGGMAVRQFVYGGAAKLHYVQVVTYTIEMLRRSLIDPAAEPLLTPQLMETAGAVTIVNDPFFHLQKGIEVDDGKGLPRARRMQVMVQPQTLALYLLLAISSNKKIIQPVEPQKFANQRRRDKGLCPVPLYHMVTLPDGWAPGFSASSGGLAPWREEEVRKTSTSH